MPGRMTSASQPKESDEHVNPSEDNPKQMYRIADAVVVLSLGRTVIYEQIRSGRLRTVTQGRTRLIPASAITEYIKLLEQEADAA
jgi:excisionase family DNA binding protein